MFASTVPGSTKWPTQRLKYPYPNTIFVLRYKQQRKRVCETLGPNHDYNLALAKAKLREADLLRGLAPYKPEPRPASPVAKPKPSSGGLMLDAAIDRYLHDVRHRAKSTGLGYKWTMMQCYKAVGNKPLSAISKADLNEGLLRRTDRRRQAPVHRTSRTTSVCRVRRESIPQSAAEGVARCPYVTFRPLSRYVADPLPNPPAPAKAPHLRVRVRPGANRLTHGPVVLRVRDRFRMRDV